MLLEKLYAKVYGGYSNIDVGFSTDALKDCNIKKIFKLFIFLKIFIIKKFLVTGAICEYIDIKKIPIEGWNKMIESHSN